ncbi:MAG TPA: sigma-70 family RNA polymerase sigma factor [Dehalococcoidia bacterium]|nr:sigma-70 family RNA polymerase sigma factor [Dehalococcoidia bacterium]
MERALLADSVADRADAEGALVDASIGGDVQAFAALYDEHVERVYKYVYYRVSNRHDAEDLTQQVFLNAWHRIGRYQRTGATFIAWLFTIAHNLVVSFHRRTKEVDYLVQEPASRQRWSDPEGETFARYDRLAVRRAILRLKPDQQQVITMRFIDDLEYQDIAAALGKTEGNIRVIQHRALRELQRLLAHEVRA